MIYVDLATGSIELLPLIIRGGCKAERTQLQFGDFAFDGYGPEGGISIGVERKTIHDMMACIKDGRFSGHQMPGMKQLYDIRILVLEGQWKPHDPDGTLMEGFSNGMSWGFFGGQRRRTTYGELFRYMVSVSLSGFLVVQTRDQWHTAYSVCELYRYFQKPWAQHTSLEEMHRLAVPSLMFKPPLVRRWAAELPGIGTKLSDLAARHFKKPLALAQADELDWVKIPGIAVKTARDIYREIRGIR